MPFISLIRPFALAVMLMSVGISALRAQSTADDVRSRLQGKDLYLRGCWNNDKLHFDSTGKMIGNPGQVTFTLCGFEFAYVYLKTDKLVIDGYRIGLELANDKVKRVRLVVGNYPRFVSEEMHLEIDAPPNGDYSTVLEAILTPQLDEMLPALPLYWQRYVRTYLAHNFSAFALLKDDHPQKRVGGGVTVPVLIETVEPEFTESARALKYGGNVVINFWVNPDGSVSHVSIVHALGIGLDEHAVAAVQRYRFKPAMENGKPVLVEVNINVNYKIYQP